MAGSQAGVITRLRFRGSGAKPDSLNSGPASAGFRDRRRFHSVDPLRPNAGRGRSYGATPAGRPRLCWPDALVRARLHGLRTNRELWSTCCVIRRSSTAPPDTGFFDTHGMAELVHRWPTPRPPVVGDAAALADAEHTLASAGRVLVDSQRLAQPGLGLSGQDVTTRTPNTASNTAHQNGSGASRRSGGTAGSADVGPGGAAQDGAAHHFTVGARHGPDVYVDFGARTRSPGGTVTLPPSRARPSSKARWRPLCPATLQLDRRRGYDTVTAGQPLIWLEAMKMEHHHAAPADGATHVSVNTGQQV